MNGVDFVSVYFIIFFGVWIHGLSHETPPARCHLFYLNATCPFHEDNKEPTMRNLEKILEILTLPQDPSVPYLTCNGTTVTIQTTSFTSTRMLNETKLNLVLNIEPHEKVEKISAYNCADNMLDQGSLMVPEVEMLLRFREDNRSAPLYTMHREACCEDQSFFNEPCCRRGYTLKNVTCVMNLEVKTDPKPVIKTGEVVMMEKETGVKCNPSFPIWMIIVMTCGGLVLFVSIVLAGMRVWKYKHRPGNEYVVTNEATIEGQPVERRSTGEIPYSVTVQVTGETKDGYIPMKNLSRTNLRSEINTTNNSIENTNPTTTTTINNTTTNNTTTNTTTSNTITITNENDSPQNSPEKRSSFRPKSRSEMLFDFDKHIPIAAIEFTSKMLGRGQFGQVELAIVTVHGIKTKCAVKMIRGRGTEEDERELFEELQMLYQIPYHPNVVSLLGGCMDEGPLYVVVEYCANGSLMKYLQSNRNSTNEYVNFSGPKLDFRWKIQRAIEICQGMIFLAQRQIIHRDLAARNILLDENEVAKISDFGMAKDVYLRGLYIKETAGFLPVRWMAIEAIESSIYTIKSDMWSFGILLWELYMDGRLPYPGVSDGSKLLLYLNKGYRMAKPENCPDSFYQLMDRCWLAKPEDRPPFTLVLRELQVIKEDETRRESEASRATEISDDLSSVFEDEEPETPQAEATHCCVNTQGTQSETQGTLEDAQTTKEEVKGNETENEPAMEIGILNQGRGSIDSGANFELRNLTQEAVERTSSC